MPKGRARETWIAYLRVSTSEQVERELSLPAQRRAVQDYAARHGRTISREYVEAGCSGTNANRKAFREMLEDVFRPGSDVGTVVVHHTSRFTRNATEARVVKEKLRKEGVRVVAVCQETNDDPVGKLIEGVFECIDQYESEVNGMRTSTAMRESVRQGYFPGSGAPFGFSRKKVEIRPNVLRSVLPRLITAGSDANNSKEIADRVDTKIRPPLPEKANNSRRGCQFLDFFVDTIVYLQGIQVRSAKKTYQYARLVQSYRRSDGKPAQKVVASLGAPLQTRERLFSARGRRFGGDEACTRGRPRREQRRG